MPRNSPKSVETASVLNHEGCAGRRSRGRSLIVNLLEHNQHQMNAAINLRCCLATQGPVCKTRSPINSSCSKISPINRTAAVSALYEEGQSFRLQLQHTSHIGGHIHFTSTVCRISQIYPELTRPLKGLNLCPNRL